MQLGREGLTLHVVHRLPSDSTVPGIVVMHHISGVMLHNGLREVMQNGCEGESLLAVRGLPF